MLLSEVLSFVTAGIMPSPDCQTTLLDRQRPMIYRMVMSDRLFEDPDLVQFYDLENGWADDSRYCQELARGKDSVLDLGCGTGMLATALAPGREVFGVDPSAAMLSRAKEREGGSAVTWIKADARTVRLGRRFDLIVLTGHTFQVFLTDDDQRAVTATISAHLAPGGFYIFDSREPARKEWQKWEPGQSLRFLEHPTLGRIEAWNDVAHDPSTGMVTYSTFYRAEDGQIWNAQSRIRFIDKTSICTNLTDAGLSVDRWLGDWRSNRWTPQSAEIIPLGGLARN